MGFKCFVGPRSIGRAHKRVWAWSMGVGIILYMGRLPAMLNRRCVTLMRCRLTTIVVNTTAMGFRVAFRCTFSRKYGGVTIFRALGPPPPLASSKN